MTTPTKGDIFRIDGRNNGTHVIVCLYEQCSHDSWYCVVVDGDDKVYPKGGYNIVLRRRAKPKG